MQKSFFIFSFFLSNLILYSQAPESFSYHALVRNEKGKAISNRAVSFHFDILKGGSAGISVYGEKQDVLTDSYGSVSIVIGKGTNTTGDFSVINWGSDSYYINVGLDTLGGNAYAEMGSSQLFSVPYALYAKTAANGFSGNYNDLINRPVTDGSETKLFVGENLKIGGTGTDTNPYIINTKSHYLGEVYGGGIIFYLYDNNQHGLIAATKDQVDGIQWYNGIKRYTNSTGDGINSGVMNTILIITQQTNDIPTGNFAAKICADYSVTVNEIVYGDWYLPSKYELSLMLIQKYLIGGFKSDYYWSSTEFSSISAWALNFSNGDLFNLNKSLPYAVRAIRSF